MLDRGELVIRPVSLHSPCETYLKPFSDIKYHSIYFSFHTGDETKEKSAQRREDEVFEM